MNSKRCAVLLAFAAIFALSSCSGVKNPCTVNCGGGGSGTLNLVLTDTPPTGVSILSFTLPISGISLTPTTGSAVSVYPGGTFELTRLQSDTSGIATNVSVPAGTYTSIQVTLGTTSGVFINASGSTITSSAGTCLSAAVCALPSGAATTISVPLNNLTFSSSAVWLGLDFNLNNAITAANGITVDLSQANVLTVNTTPPTGSLPNGDTAFIDDFTGSVTAISNSSITVSSTTRGSLTAVINSSTPVYDPQLQCPGQTGSLSCIQVGSVVSFQGALSTNALITATSLDVIDVATKPADEVEGTIYPAVCNGGNNYGLIISDSLIATSGSPLAGAKYGQPVCLTVSPTATFAIDSGILFGQAGIPTSANFTSASNLYAGQTVRAKITGAVAGASNSVNATATYVILRFSRLTGTVSSTSGAIVSLTGLPAYITALPLTAQVSTYPNATLMENFTSINSLASPNVVSISALLLGPTSGVTYPLHAAKIRLQ